MTLLLHAKRLLTGQGWLDDHQLYIKKGIIMAIELIPSGVMVRDTELFCPAYIGTHVHGGVGADVTDEAPDILDKLTMHRIHEGAANWLPTTIIALLPDIHKAFERIAHRYHSGRPGAQVLGSYLEGPHFMPQNKGAHPPEPFRELKLGELDELIAISQQILRVVALAPEKPGALQTTEHLK